MHRDLTNLCRFLLDECLPPLIRDNYWFMYPFFWYCYKSKNVRLMMEFKSYYHTLSEEQFAILYRELDCLSRDRATDLNTRSLNYILSQLDRESTTLLDVGCGSGFFLEKARDAGFEVTGCDLLKAIDIEGCVYVQGNVEQLPFQDRTFDIVTCHHTLEHVRNLSRAVAELKRVAGRQLIVTVPCQRFFRYTLDLHLHFFPLQSILEDTMRMENGICKKVWGDWVYIGTPDRTQA